MRDVQNIMPLYSNGQISNSADVWLLLFGMLFTSRLLRPPADDIHIFMMILGNNHLELPVTGAIHQISISFFTQYDLCDRIVSMDKILHFINTLLLLLEESCTFQELCTFQRYE